jgi:prophage regulatory protein
MRDDGGNGDQADVDTDVDHRADGDYDGVHAERNQADTDVDNDVDHRADVDGTEPSNLQQRHQRDGPERNQADTDLLLYPDLRLKGIAFTKIYLAELERKGKFPKRVRLGGPTAKAYGWVRAEIDAYLAEQIAARDEPPAEGNAQTARMTWAQIRPRGPGSMRKRRKRRRATTQSKQQSEVITA